MTHQHFTMILPLLLQTRLLTAMYVFLTVSFDEIMAAAAKEQQQHHQQANSSVEPSSPAAAGAAAAAAAAAADNSRQAAAEPLRATGCFTGTASQSRPIPLHVLEQEYEMVHQVGSNSDSMTLKGRPMTIERQVLPLPSQQLQCLR
jgi:hypothetical protein